MNHAFPTDQIDQSPLRSADGIVCFGGEDWWYHNRGHFDMRMMRELSAREPVIYVNSIGMRVPSAREGGVFAHRVRRKLKSLRRGHEQIDDKFSVLTVPAIPGGLSLAATRPLAARKIRAACARRAISRPLVWIACPTAAAFIDDLDPVAVVYQRTDRYEEYSGVDADRIRRYDQWLKARADFTVFCSSFLHREEAAACRRALLVDHGVDAENFIAITGMQGREPSDIASLPRPRVGFVGGIDNHTFDQHLFNAVAGRMPGVQFIVVGSSTLPNRWCTLPNVTFPGQKPVEQVGEYMRSCDVLIMPWKQSRWIEACNPVKLKEYLASGRPIVSTPFPELENYEDLVRIAAGPDSFVREINAAIASPGDARTRQSRVRNESWRSKATRVIDALSADRIVLQGTGATQLPPIEPKTPHSNHTSLGHTESTSRNGTVRSSATEKCPEPLPFHVAAPAGSPKIGMNGTAHAPEPGRNRTIASCIVLGGSLRPSALVRAARCSVLDLWMTPEQTVLDLWLDRFGGCEPWINDRCRIRVVHDRVTPAPRTNRRTRFDLRIGPEAAAYRGAAGIVADACRDLDPNCHVLIVEAARYAGVELNEFLHEHFQRGDDVTVARNPDRSPAGLYVVRADALQLVAESGFTDLKEQWIPKVMTSGYDIGVHTFANPGIMPLWTREQFLDAAAHANHSAENSDDLHDSAVNDSGLRVICPGALVGPGAVIVDSIVMPGAHIGSRAIVARSLICSHSEVCKGEEITRHVVKEGHRPPGEPPHSNQSATFKSCNAPSLSAEECA